MEQHLASLVPKRRSGIAAPPGVGITLAQHSHRKHVPGSLSRRKKRPDSDRPTTPTFRHHKPGSRPGFLSGRRPVPKTAFVPGSPEHVPGAEQYAFKHEARKQDGQYVFRQKDDDPLLPLQHLLGEPAVHAALRVEALHWNVKGLRDEHARGLGHVLYHNKRLTEVGLARNQLGDEAIVMLARVLPACGALRMLWLSGNRIGDDGAGALGEALPALGWMDRGSLLEELWLSANLIGDAGAAALADALPRAAPRQNRPALQPDWRRGRGGARPALRSWARCSIVPAGQYDWRRGRRRARHRSTRVAAAQRPPPRRQPDRRRRRDGACKRAHAVPEPLERAAGSG